MAKEILVGFGIDVDAVAGWLGSYGGEDSPDDISRGMFAGEVGSPRLLDLFDKLGIKTTWFIPGHSAETFPEQMRDVARRGHDAGVALTLFGMIGAVAGHILFGMNFSIMSMIGVIALAGVVINESLVLVEVVL